MVKDIGSTVQEKEDRTTQILSNIVNNTIAMKLEKTIKAEMKQTVLHGMEKVAAKYFESMNNQIAQVPTTPYRFISTDLCHIYLFICEFLPRIISAY